MAVTTDSMVAVSSGGVNYDFYGLSKTIYNYTFDEIWDYVFCSSSSNSIFHIGYGGTDMSYYTYEANDNYVPFELRYVATNHNYGYYHEDAVMNNPDGLYMRVIWLQRTSNGSNDYIDNSSAIGNQYKIITEFDAKHYVYEAETPQVVNNNYGATDWNEGSYLYYSSGGNLYYYDDLTAETPVRINIPRVIPAIIFKDKNNKGYIIPYRQAINKFETINNTEVSGWNPRTATTYKAYDSNNYIAFPVVAKQLYTYLNSTTGELTSPMSDGFKLPEGSGIYPQARYGTTVKNNLISLYACGGSSGYQLGFQQFNYFTTAEECKKFFSLAGLHFKADKIYKPIIEGGYVTGFTDQLTTASDLDNWDGKTKHTVPITPPVPPVPEDDPSDDQAWGGAYSGAGAFSKFYLCTATDLANLRTWFAGGGHGDQIPDGFDPMGQVLGLLQYPVSISGTALAPEEILFRSGKTIVHTGVNADRSTGGFLHLDCGSVEIPRRMQERGVPFLDFETTLEIYVPFCGTAPLDVQTCVGKTLTCDMYVATATGDVSAVIAAGGHPVAYMSGNMAESLPISSAGYGMYLAACKSTWGNGVSQVMNQITGGTTDTIKNVNQAALNETLSYSQTGGWSHSELIAESYNNPVIGRNMAGAASAKGAAVGGLIKTGLNVMNAATTGYEQYQRVKHASYTSVSGSFTSCAAWNYPFTPYVKITRPHKQIPTGGRGDYKHTAAIPLVETRTLSGAPGLTTCVNPDVSGITNATAQEKDIIYRALVNGVIV